MRNLALGRSLDFFEEDATFLEASLLAREETASLAAPVTALLADGQGLGLRAKLARRSQLQRRARVVVADGLLDEQIRTLQIDALIAVRQDRKEPAFSTLFPENLRNTIRYALRRQLEVARGLVSRLGLALLPQETRQQHEAAFAPLLVRGQEALDEQTEVELEVTRLRLEIQDWKQDLNNTRLQIYSELLRLAAAKKLTRDWAERFFLTYDSSGAVSAEEDEAPAAQA